MNDSEGKSRPLTERWALTILIAAITAILGGTAGIIADGWLRSGERASEDQRLSERRLTTLERDQAALRTEFDRYVAGAIVDQSKTRESIEAARADMRSLSIFLGQQRGGKREN